MGLPVKYISIANTLRHQIAQGIYQPGDSLPSEYKLAVQFNVNRLTIRKSLAKLAEDDLVIRRPGVGTIVKPSPRATTANTILYIGKTEGDLHRKLYHAIADDAQEKHRTFTSFDPDKAGPSGFKSPFFRRLISAATHIICIDWYYDSLCAIGIPDVPVTTINIYGEESPSTRVPKVGYILQGNASLGARFAVRYLAEYGHQDIALLCPAHSYGQGLEAGAPSPNFGPYRGYLDGIQDISSMHRTVIGLPSIPKIDSRNDIETQADLLMQALQQLPSLPTAYICFFDYAALAVYRVAEKLGLNIPRDISVIGMNNTPWCEAMHPSLTSVSLEEHTLAKLATVMVTLPIPDTRVVLEIHPTLIQRESVGHISAPTQPAKL